MYVRVRSTIKSVFFSLLTSFVPLTNCSKMGKNMKSRKHPSRQALNNLSPLKLSCFHAPKFELQASVRVVCASTRSSSAPGTFAPSAWTLRVAPLPRRTSRTAATATRTRSVSIRSENQIRPYFAGKMQVSTYYIVSEPHTNKTITDRL